MGKQGSERRKQRKHFLKQMKKRLSTIEFNEMKKEFREEGKTLRVNDLRESLDIEKEKLGEQEGLKRDKLKADGLSKKEIDKQIDAWYDNVKIWSLHKDVEDNLI